MSPATIGLLAFELESHRLGQPASLDLFHRTHWLERDGFAAALEHDRDAILPFTQGFVDEAKRQAWKWRWEPLLSASALAAGPMPDADWTQLRGLIDRALDHAEPLDALFAYLHGAAVTDSEDAPEATLVRDLRKRLGPYVPIVVVMDLHGHVPDLLVEAADVVVAHRHNPHTDDRERGAECANHMQRLLSDDRPFIAHRRLPLVAPQLTQLTRPPYPLGKARALADALIENANTAAGGDDVWSVSLMPGYAFTDSFHQGLSVLVNASSEQTASIIADRLATQLWQDRSGFLPTTISIAVAIERCRQGGPWLLVDCGDNPGGGAPGTRLDLVVALDQAGVDALHGFFCDAELAAAAHRAGVGGTVEWVGESGTGVCKRSALVLQLSSGRYRSRDGITANRTVSLGSSALLASGRQRIVVVSVTDQPYDTSAFIELFGLDPLTEAVLVFKARGHFRTAFEPLFGADHILEVSTPGLTSPDLASFPWRRLRRPAYPIDVE